MTEPTLPDLKAGVPLSTLADGAMLRGRVDGEDAILLRQGDALYAIGAQCTHYHAELADGLLRGQVLHCPMHHAQFDIRSGEALCAPALDSLPCWRVERADGQAFVRERVVAPPRSHRDPPLADVVIVGIGADHRQAAAVPLAAEHVGSRQPGRTAADDDDIGRRRILPRPRRSDDALANERLLAGTLDAPARQRVERRCAQRLAATDVELRVVHRAMQHLALEQAIDELGVVVGALRADRVQRIALSQEDRVFAVDAAAQHRAVGERRKRNTGLQIRQGGFGHGKRVVVGISRREALQPHTVLRSRFT